VKFKSNLVIGVIFAALLAFVYFHEIKGGEERRKEAERSKQLLDFKETEVQRLTLLREHATIVLDKTAEGWRLSSPVEDGADADAVERYLRNILEGEREKVIVDSADAAGDEVAARYGFAEPRLQLLIETEDGPLDTLLFGGDTPTDRYTYVRQSGDNAEIFVVRAWRYDNLDKAVFDLRDRRVLALNKSEVVEARRRRVEGETVLVKENGEWLLQAPIVARADAAAVDALLLKIESSEIEAFVDGNADAVALKSYGLGEESELQWSLLVGADRAEKRLIVGREDGEGRYYARDISRAQVFLIDSTLVQQLRRPVDELRDKKPLRFARGTVSRIELSHAAQVVFITEKDTAGTWSITAPESYKAKSWKLNTLLTDLSGLEATGFGEAIGGDALLDIELADGAQVLSSMHFVGRDGEIFLEQDGDAASYRIELDDFAELDLELDDIMQAVKAVDAATDSAAVGD